MRDLVPGWKKYVQCWWEGAPCVHAPRGCQSLVPSTVTQKSVWRVFSRCTRQQMMAGSALAIHMSYACLCIGYLEESTLGYCTCYYHICLQGYNHRQWATYFKLMPDKKHPEKQGASSRVGMIDWEIWVLQFHSTKKLYFYSSYCLISSMVACLQI